MEVVFSQNALLVTGQNDLNSGMTTMQSTLQGFMTNMATMMAAGTFAPPPPLAAPHVAPTPFTPHIPATHAPSWGPATAAAVPPSAMDVTMAAGTETAAPFAFGIEPIVHPTAHALGPVITFGCDDTVVNTLPEAVVSVHSSPASASVTDSERYEPESPAPRPARERRALEPSEGELTGDHMPDAEALDPERIAMHKVAKRGNAVDVADEHDSAL